jgi:hypothetical protein
MRIISDFHDYYDVGMQNGIDPQLPYRRFRREEPFNLVTTRYARYNYLGDYYCFFYIGFAGKIWSCIDTSFGTDKPSSLCFDQDLLDESFFIEIFEKRFGKRWRPNAKYSYFGVPSVKGEVIKCFEYKNRPELLDVFEKFKTAIFVYRLESSTVIVNERLNQYGFQKVLPPMQAYQELEMYVGACLTRPVIEEPPIPDKIKVEIHGFDKYSFRKDKSRK